MNDVFKTFSQCCLCLYQLLKCFFTVYHMLGEKALADAGIPYSAIEQACVGYVYGKTFTE